MYSSDSPSEPRLMGFPNVKYAEMFVRTKVSQVGAPQSNSATEATLGGVRVEDVYLYFTDSEFKFARAQPHGNKMYKVLATARSTSGDPIHLANVSWDTPAVKFP